MKNNFVKTPINPVINVTAFYTVHYFNYGRKFSFEGESHNFWELVYVDRGEATIVADDKQHILRQGEAYFHKPNQFHNIFTFGRRVVFRGQKSYAVTRRAGDSGQYSVRIFACVFG